MQSLRGDEFTGHASHETTSALVAEVSEEDYELVVRGGQGRDVVPFVIGVCAGEGLASGDRCITVLGEDHLNAYGVRWVDDGGDVEVGGVSEAVEAEFCQHAGDSRSSLRDREEVADPAVWHGLVRGPKAFND